ncbi:MAG: hypothetical protein KatS3mg108_1567 [Isosphaeraceae bacterium]|jgi:hypothetical protein|nr:MAG: hypothetical protein KatS3mg108_1567 [Isosphaeraceae bacterium]
MAHRSNHYEAAFEARVRADSVPCVAIDQTRRPLTAAGGLKNPDFILYPRRGPNLVVEVKGKIGKRRAGPRSWENWVTTDDLDGLARWQAMFGPGFRAVLAFVYAEPRPEFGLPAGEGGFEFRGRVYRFWTIAYDDYIEHLRSRGPAWKAVAMARREFRRRVRPLSEWLAGMPVCPPTARSVGPSRFARTPQ